MSGISGTPTNASMLTEFKNVGANKLGPDERKVLEKNANIIKEHEPSYDNTEEYIKFSESKRPQDTSEAKSKPSSNHAVNLVDFGKPKEIGKTIEGVFYVPKFKNYHKSLDEEMQSKNLEKAVDMINNYVTKEHNIFDPKATKILDEFKETIKDIPTKDLKSYLNTIPTDKSGAEKPLVTILKNEVAYRISQTFEKTQAMLYKYEDEKGASGFSKIENEFKENLEILPTNALESLLRHFEDAVKSGDVKDSSKVADTIRAEIEKRGDGSNNTTEHKAPVKLEKSNTILELEKERLVNDIKTAASPSAFKGLGH